MSALGLPLQLFLGGTLAKAERRGKVHSVDRTIRASHNVALEKRMKALFGEWRDKMKKRVAEAYGTVKKAEVDDIVNDILERIGLDGFSLDVVDELTPELKRAFMDAGISGIAEIGSGISTDQLDPLAEGYMAAHGADLVTQITETTRNDLREILTDAITNGLSVDDLADQIGDAFGFSDYRSEMIARTELAYAHVGGNMAAYRESGLVAKKRWLVAQDNVCPECEDLADTVVDLDEDFPDAGDGPPLHPNCRCDVVPVLAQEESDNADTGAEE